MYLPKFTEDLLQVEVRPVGGLDGHLIGQITRHGLHKAVHPLQLPYNVHNLDGNEVFRKRLSSKIDKFVDSHWFLMRVRIRIQHFWSMLIWILIQGFNGYKLYN